MTKQLKNYNSDAERIAEVTKQLQRVSNLYGFKIPVDPGIALELVKFVCEDFKFITADQIGNAFKAASMGKLNVDITSYGQTLTITMIAKVLREYRKAVRASTKKKKAPSKKDAIKLNIQARLSLLQDLETPGAVIRFNHFDLINSYIEKIPAEVFEEAVKQEMETHRIKLEGSNPVTKAEKYNVNQELNQLKSIATVKAKVRLATEYAANNIINTPEVESRIKAGTPIE